MVVATPHLDGPPEFSYAGKHYQDGWRYVDLTENAWFVSMTFAC